MMLDFVFYTGLTLLVVHELDAVHRCEWRMFPVLSRLDDQKGYRFFVLLHVPLFMMIFWFMNSPDDDVRYGFQAVMDIFFMVHFGLHRLMKDHVENGFSGIFSKTIIGMTAASGAFHLALLFLTGGCR